MNGYFDHNATTPMFPQARERLAELCAKTWHNPSSLYPEAAAAKRELEACREWLADYLGVDEPTRIVFTSGATESNNIVIRHEMLMDVARYGVLTSAIEHPSVLEPVFYHFNRHFSTSVDETGQVDLDQLADDLGNMLVVASLMAANNETGVIQPWERIRDLCRENGVPYHTDATQWFGKLPVGDLASCDWVTGSAHKFGGPKGVGFLIVPESCNLTPGAQIGGPQENRLRGGTENVPAISAMIAALQTIQADFPDSQPKAADRDAFESAVRDFLPETRIIGENALRLWNTSMLVVPKHKNLKWLTRLADSGFQISTGSACSSGKGAPSHVMEAMGLDFDEMGRVLRISGGWETAADDWSALADAFAKTWKDLDSAKSPTRKKVTL